MKPIQFKYVLSENFELQTDEIEKMTSFFIDKNGLVPYNELIQIIEKFDSKEEDLPAKPECHSFLVILFFINFNLKSAASIKNMDQIKIKQAIVIILQPKMKVRVMVMETKETLPENMVIKQVFFKFTVIFF